VFLNTGRKLLLADDSPTVRKVVSLTFGDEGMLVTAVGGGEEALAEIGREVPDIILADVHMPAPDGYELCARVKGDERTRHVPVVLLVGSFEPFDVSEARRVGADDVLTKPFQSIRELVNKVGGLLGGQSGAKSSGAREDEPPASADVTPAPRVAEELRAAAAEPDATPQSFPDIDLDDGGIEAASAEEFAARKPVDASAPPDGDLFEIHADAEEEEILMHTDDFALGEEPGGPQSFAARASADAPRAFTPDERRPSDAAADDFLLDLDDAEPPRTRAAAAASDEFILDFEDESPVAPQAGESDASFAESAAPFGDDLRAPEASPAAAGRQVAPENLSSAWGAAAEVFDEAPEAVYEQPGATRPGAASEAAAGSADWFASLDESAAAKAPVAAAPEQAAPAAARAQQPSGPVELAPETIEAIARRVVELMSDKVVREIAWEVVPEMAELLVRQKLEEERR
jgi:CheY-like chemotaxis protein